MTITRTAFESLKWEFLRHLLGVLFHQLDDQRGEFSRRGAVFLHEVVDVGFLGGILGVKSDCMTGGGEVEHVWKIRDRGWRVKG